MMILKSSAELRGTAELMIILCRFVEWLLSHHSYLTSHLYENTDRCSFKMQSVWMCYSINNTPKCKISSKWSCFTFLERFSGMKLWYLNSIAVTFLPSRHYFKNWGNCADNNGVISALSGKGFKLGFQFKLHIKGFKFNIPGRFSCRTLCLPSFLKKEYKYLGAVILCVIIHAWLLKNSSYCPIQVDFISLCDKHHIIL